MLKQMRTKVFIPKNEISSSRKKIIDYINDEEYGPDIDVRCEEMSFDDILSLFHLTGEYDEEGNLVNMKYTGNANVLTDDLSAVSDIFKDGMYIDFLGDDFAKRFLVECSNFSELDISYCYSWFADADKSTSDLRSLLVNMDIDSLAEIFNNYCDISGMSNRKLFKISEFNQLLSGLSPLEIISQYGYLHDTVHNAVMFTKVRRSYIFLDEEYASRKILHYVAEIAAFAAENKTGFGNKELEALL